VWVILVYVSEMTFEEFNAAELAAWLARSRSGYISERMASGDTRDEATANADASIDRSFPGGSPGPGQMVGWVSYGGVRVGELWVGPFGDDPQRWWVWDVVIDETRRGQGLGRRTMILAEDLAAAHGAASLGLNVVAGNTVARRLYRSLGYEETSIQMRKSLLPGP
jgi:ribosomal protein S18 acetylase RimI-like enzyme